MTDNGGSDDRVVTSRWNPERSAWFWAILGACLVAFAVAVLSVVAWLNYTSSASRQRAMIESSAALTDSNATILAQNVEIQRQLDDQKAENAVIAAELEANRQEDRDRAECIRRFAARTEDLRWAYVSTLGDVLVTYTTFIHGDPSQIAQVLANADAVKVANDAANAAAAEEAAYTAQDPPPLPCPLTA